jgi:hypothetical protein
MGESRPNQATAPDCQPLTEQPGKDLQTMGFVPGLQIGFGVAAFAFLLAAAGSMFIPQPRTHAQV